MKQNEDFTLRLYDLKQDYKTRLGIIPPAEANRERIKRKVRAGELTPTEALFAYHSTLKEAYPSAGIDREQLQTAIQSAVSSALLDLNTLLKQNLKL